MPPLVGLEPPYSVPKYVFRQPTSLLRGLGYYKPDPILDLISNMWYSTEALEKR